MEQCCGLVADQAVDAEPAEPPGVLGTVDRPRHDYVGHAPQIANNIPVEQARVDRDPIRLSCFRSAQKPRELPLVADGVETANGKADEWLQKARRSGADGESPTTDVRRQRLCHQLTKPAPAALQVEEKLSRGPCCRE